MRIKRWYSSFKDFKDFLKIFLFIMNKKHIRKLLQLACYYLLPIGLVIASLFAGLDEHFYKRTRRTSIESLAFHSLPDAIHSDLKLENIKNPHGLEKRVWCSFLLVLYFPRSWDDVHRKISPTSMLTSILKVIYFGEQWLVLGWLSSD